MTTFIAMFLAALVLLTLVVGSLAGLILLAVKIGLRYWPKNHAAAILLIVFSMLVWLSLMVALQVTFGGTG